ANRTGDRMLRRLALVTKSQILQTDNRIDECSAALRETLDAADGFSVEVFGRFEGVLAVALLRLGDNLGAHSHVRRARRLCRVVTHIPCLTDIDTYLGTVGDSVEVSEACTDGLKRTTAANVLHSLCVAILQGSQPKLVAAEFAEALLEA